MFNLAEIENTDVREGYAIEVIKVLDNMAKDENGIYCLDNKDLFYAFDEPLQERLDLLSKYINKNSDIYENKDLRYALLSDGVDMILSGDDEDLTYFKHMENLN